MTNAAQQFHPVAAAIELHAMLAVAVENSGFELDLILHGKSGLISVFESREWQGRGPAVCDISPTKNRSWYLEWADGKMMTGNGGPYALTKLIMDGIETHMKRVF